jgi:hypothetical protein
MVKVRKLFSDMSQRMQGEIIKAIFLSENPKERGHLKVMGVDGKV